MSPILYYRKKKVLLFGGVFEYRTRITKKKVSLVILHFVFLQENYSENIICLLFLNYVVAI